MSFPRYPAYKDSGVEWLGEVPEGWAVCALNYRYDVALGKMLDEKRITGNHLAPYLRNVDVQWGRINIDDLPEMDFSGNDIARYRLDAGDLLVCEGGEVGRAAMWRGAMPECYYQKALHRVRPKNKRTDNPAFLYYILAAAASRSIFAESGGKSTIAHLTAEAFRRYRFAFPPKSDQTTIATFLDRETAKIDALVADYRTLIELLQEKRQAAISHAVTKGLDPTVPMKDSGVEWLGELPEHWRVVRLAELFREANDSGEEDLPILTVSIHHGVSDKEYEEDELERKVTRSDDRSKYKTVRPGDLVYNMMRAWQGGFGAVVVNGLVSPAYVVARPIVPVSTSFIEQVLRCPTAVEEMRRRSHGVTDFRLRLYWQEFRDIRVGMPPLEEQAETMRLVLDQTAKFEGLISDAEEAISLLQERRTALISAAVTGKIDVRGLVAIPETDLVRSCG
ncbi:MULTISPECIES: restriction endonuclease subunit S [unclassified Thiocapsa]|uniref:restriction endonuclease subunit S n=1 Tax=unclassified Thiocapsa TaxID=2641286 RepID=UPI0035B4F461